MATGLGAGLAGGLQSGVQLGMQMKYLKGFGLDNARKDKELEWKQQDRDKAQADTDKNDQTLSGLADIADDAGLSFRTDGSGQPMMGAPQTQPIMMDPGFNRMPGFAAGGLISLKPRGYAAGGMIPEAAFSQDPSAAYQAGSLASVARPAQPQPKQEPNQESLNPSQRITKAMMTTDLLTNPDKLSKMHAYAEMNGMGDKFKPFLERAYAAKKSGMIDGAMQLMNGQVDEAIDSLARGGIKLEDRPKQVDPKNPRLWKINISGAGEREMDIGDLLQTTLDPEKFLKHDLSKNESEGKRNVSDSAVRKNDSGVRVDNARIGKLGEETKNIRLERTTGGGLGGSGISKLPAPAAIAEWLVRNGVHDNYKDAFNAATTLNDKSPSAARTSLIEAAMKNGSTISEAAKEVDGFLEQTAQGGNSGGLQPTAPKDGVRKYNPKTGGFD